MRRFFVVVAIVFGLVLTSMSGSLFAKHGGHKAGHKAGHKSGHKKSGHKKSGHKHKGHKTGTKKTKKTKAKTKKIKTKASANKVFRDFADVHLEIGVQAMTELDERSDKVRHFEW